MGFAATPIPLENQVPSPLCLVLVSVDGPGLKGGVLVERLAEVFAPLLARNEHQYLTRHDDAQDLIGRFHLRRNILISDIQPVVVNGKNHPETKKQTKQQ